MKEDLRFEKCSYAIMTSDGCASMADDGCHNGTPNKGV